MYLICMRAQVARAGAREARARARGAADGAARPPRALVPDAAPDARRAQGMCCVGMRGVAAVGRLHAASIACPPLPSPPPSPPPPSLCPWQARMSLGLRALHCVPLTAHIRPHIRPHTTRMRSQHCCCSLLAQCTESKRGEARRANSFSGKRRAGGATSARGDARGARVELECSAAAYSTPESSLETLLCSPLPSPHCAVRVQCASTSTVPVLVMCVVPRLSY